MNKIELLYENFRKNGSSYAEIEFSPIEVHPCIDLVPTEPDFYALSKQSTPNVQPLSSSMTGHTPYANYQSKHPVMRHSLNELQHYIRRWSEPTPTRKQKKDRIELASENPFSDRFIELLGKANATNIQKLDDEHLRIQVFTGLLEAEAIGQVQEESNTVLLELINFSDRNIHISSRIVNGKLLWKIGSSEKREGFIELIKHLFYIPFLDALATLMNILGMSYEKTFFVFDTHQVAESSPTSKYVDDITIKYCAISPNAYLQQKALIPIKGYADQTIGGIATYNYNGIAFFLPVSSAKEVLSIGRYQAKACWLNHDKIDSNRTAIILLCQSLYTAFALQKIYENASNIIVTAHYGENIDCYSWNYFYGRTVILICAPSKPLFSRAGEYYNKLLTAKVGLCTIYPFPLLHFDNSTNLGVADSKLSELEQELIIQSRYFDREKSPDLLLKHIVEESLSFTDFCSWGQRLYLFKGQKSRDTKATNEAIFFTMENGSSNLPQSFADIQLADVFPFDGTSLIHAPKNAGKSNCVLTVIRALSRGKAFVGIRNQGQEKRCMLLDTETLPDILRSRCKQFGLHDVQGKTFFPISKLASSANSEWGSYDISNKVHQDMSTELVKKENIAYFILDNITSGTKAGGAYIQAIAGEIFEYSEVLR